MLEMLFLFFFYLPYYTVSSSWTPGKGDSGEFSFINQVDNRMIQNKEKHPLIDFIIRV